VALTNVMLRSVSGPTATIIDGAGAVRCAVLHANAILSGFTLRNGTGGVAASSSAVVTNCVLTGNSGSGASGGTLYNCTLAGNEGGGANGGTLYNCTLTGNQAAEWGGGARGCTLYNCVLTGNSARYVGGASYSTLYNCTLIRNSAADGVGGAQDSTLYNCIVYSNQWGNWSDATFEYCCTTPLPPGRGNIAADPQFVSAAHLSAASPCLGAGSSEWATGVDMDGERWADPPAMGADQVWPGQSIGPLTMQITTLSTEVAVGFPVHFTADNSGPILQSVWDFGDGTVLTNQPFTSHAWTASGAYTVRLTGYNDSHPEGAVASTQIQVTEAVHYVNRAHPTPVFPYTSWASAATNIQDAVNAGTVTGRLVLVTNGVYQNGAYQSPVQLPVFASSVVLTNVVLRSVNGPEVTIIDGAHAARCISLEGDSILSGFTLRNGMQSGCFPAPGSFDCFCPKFEGRRGGRGFRCQFRHRYELRADR
jgi:hypothetical protein